ncbi:MAG TPA: helix-turn-helix domain-containing protein [Gemmatimonadales bacterium]|nr:helix-turn-helix domain-containing protein [Gemmatimonadales bacterium]
MQIDRYVVETLMPDLVGHDRQPSAFLVYLYLWAVIPAGARSRELSLREIAEGTGLSKRAVQDALACLIRRELVSAERDSITAAARYTLHQPWRRRSGM